MLAGNSKVSRCLPFVEAPVWGKFTMPKQRLHQVWHRSDLVKLVDRILIAIVVDNKWKDCPRWGGNTGAHAMALKAGITWYCYVAGMARGQRCKGTECTLLEAAAGLGKAAAP